MRLVDIQHCRPDGSSCVLEERKEAGRPGGQVSPESVFPEDAEYLPVHFQRPLVNPAR